MKPFKLLDTVATLKPIGVDRLTLVEPEYASIQSLPVGQIGTIVEIYRDTKALHYLVEFADLQGHE